MENIKSELEQMNNENIEEKNIEEMKREAFMEGYAYAIRVLQERIPKKKK